MFLSKSKPKNFSTIMAAVVGTAVICAAPFFSAEAKGETVRTAWAVQTNTGKPLAFTRTQKNAQEIKKEVEFILTPEQSGGVETVSNLKVAKKYLENKNKIYNVDQAVEHIVNDVPKSVEIRAKGNSVSKKKIKKKVIYQKTDELEAGVEKVLENGKDGMTSQNIHVSMENGEVTSEADIGKAKTIEPKDKIVLVGTAPPNSEYADDIDIGDAKDIRSKIIQYAEKYLGTKYVWAGKDLENGIDCSGFTMMVYRHFGYSLPHQSDMQASCGKEVESIDKAKPGDLIIYSGHVALYMGNNQIIHATPPHVQISNNAAYREILHIRRIVE